MSAYPAAVAAGWHPIATARELARRGSRPLARLLMDRPIVLFTGKDGPAAFLDRCPHRNFPLSGGKVRAGQIECPYHGWRFDGAGHCALTPGADEPARHEADTLPLIERAGMLWTCLASTPPPFPVLPHPMEAEGFDSFLWPVRSSKARLLDAIENHLDPAHPHFLHSGIVRSDQKRRDVEVTVRVGPEYAEAAYVENARPTALVPRLLEGLRSTGYGRFYPPTLGQVAFEGDEGLRLAITVAFTPESETSVRPFAHFSTPNGRAPAWLKELALRAAHVPILAQDRAALRLQAENVERFGGPRYAMGPLDVLARAVQQLADGQRPEASEETVTLRL